MRKLSAALLLCLVVPFLGEHVVAQENVKKDDQKSTDTRSDERQQLKVQIVFSEFEGDKKIKSLPYALLATASREVQGGKIRMGSRVPIYTGGPNSSMTYVDVGTNIDCRAEALKDGKYALFLTLERSWVEGNVSVPVEHHNAGTNDGSAGGNFYQPIIRQFRSDVNLALRDGQSVETNFATDPVSGKVVKLEVSLSVLK